MLLICAHRTEITKCEVCSLVYKQYGRFPSEKDPMVEEVADMEDQLVNTDKEIHK